MIFSRWPKKIFFSLTIISLIFPQAYVFALGGNFQPENTFVDDVYNTNTKVASSNDTAIDTVNHRFFVLDEENNRVLVYNLNASNEFIDRVADNVLGQANFYQNSFGTTNKKFNEPSSIEIDLDNSRLFVADSENHRVLVFDVTTVTNAESAINVLGQPDFTTGTSGVTDSKMDTPNGLAYDSNRDYLFVSDSANLRVTIFDTGHISNGDSYISYLGTPFLSGIGDMVFGATSGLFFEDKNKLLFVSDFLNNRVLVFDLVSITNGEAATHVLCQPDMMSNGSGTTASTCSFPFSVVGDSLNGTYIYVGDAGNARVLKFDINTLTNGEPAVSVLGQSDFTSNTQNVTQSGLSSVYGLSILPDSILYVSDKEAHRTMIFDVTAIVDGEDAVDGLGHIDANGDMDFTSSSSPSLSNDTLGPGGYGGLAFSSLDGFLYVADSLFNRVLLYGTTDGLITSEITTNVIGQGNMITISSATSDTGMSTPTDVAADSLGNVYVADTANSRVLVFDVSSFGSPGAAAVHVLGQPDFTSNTQNLSIDGLNTPVAVEVDSVKNLLYVADSQNHRVVVYDISTITDGEPAVSVLGQPDFVTDNGLITSASSVSYASGLALDQEGQRLFVADDNRVMVFDVDSITNGEDAVHVIGAPDFTDTSESVTNDDFSNLYDVAYDADANVLYTAEMLSNRVLAFDVRTVDDGESASGVIGQTDYTTSTSTTELDGFDIPISVSFDSNTRRLYVRDSNNNRVAIYVIPTLTTSSIASVATVGTTYSQNFLSSDTQGTESLELVSGSLPDGISISDTELTGTPTTAGTYTFTLRIADGVTPGDIYTNDRTFSIVVSNPVSGGGGSSGSVPYACNDNQDNDGDGQVDFPFDVGCTSYTDTSEYNTSVPSLFACNDAGDNDGDGFVDMQDPGCVSPFDNDESNSPQVVFPECNDGIDNDADGKIDFQTNSNGDSGCISPFDSSELNSQPTPDTTNEQEDVTFPSGDTIPATTVDSETPSNNGNNLPHEESQAENPDAVDGVLGTTDRCDYELPPNASVITVIRNEVVHTYCVVREVVDTTYTQIESVLNFGGTNPLAQIIAIVGLVMGALFSIAPTLFLNPFSFTEVVFIPYRIWTLILNAFGLKKRNRPWGTVYDSVTKQPLDPVIVSLYDTQGVEVATSITDMDGRYGFLVPPGVYRMVAKKTHYQFPSTKLAGHTRDELYLDLYYGTPIEVKSQGDVLIKNIPLDPIGFDWNEFAKRDQKLMKFFSKKDLVVARISDALFGIGFAFSIVALMTGPTLYNIIIFATYIFFMVVRETGVSRKAFGSVKNENGAPLSFAIMRIFTSGSDTEVAHKVTNELGKYFCLIQNGSYYFTIEKKNSDESYTKIYTSSPVEVGDGLIREKVTIRG